MRYEKIKTSLFVRNRSLFKEKMKPDSIAVFCSNDIMPTSADGTMPFKQDSDMFWMSGIDQEESTLVIFPDSSNNNHKEILFLKETNNNIAIWEGEKLSKQDAFEVSGIKNVYWNNEFDKIFDSLISQASTIYLNSNKHARATKEVETRTDRFNKICKEKYQHLSYEESAYLLHDLRSIKDPIEVDLLQKACDITEKAFRRVLEFVSPNVKENEIEAEFIHEFLINQSNGFAYQPIIASGKNACVLHYTKNNKICKDGDILLMDVGAEYANYCADMSRSIPVNGRFNKRQKEVYNSVLKVMKKAIKMLRPNVLLNEYHNEVGQMMQFELLSLGLIDKTDIKNQDKSFPAYKKYFMHGTSHFLGLDVHDVGDFSNPIKENMVFTCEPGIYIPEEGLGIRIENDVLVTASEPVDLMKKIPIEVDEIEDLMN